MSHLPPGWVWAETGAVAEVQGGIQKQPKRAPKSNSYPFLRVANVSRGRLDLTNVHQIELFDGELEKFRLRSGDILVVEGNGSPDQIGRSAVWLGEIDDCVHQNHLIRIRPTEAIIPKFLDYYWNSTKTMEYLRAVASSTSGLHVLTTRKVRSVRVPLPPVEEQGRIVAAIEEQFSKFASGADSLRRVAHNLRRMRASVLQEAMLGRLVPQDLSEGHAADELRHFTGRRRFTKGMPEPTLDGHELPQSWAVAYMEDLAERVTVGHVGPMQSEYVPDGIPFLRSQNVRMNRFDPAGLKYISLAFHEEIRKSRLRPEDVVIVRSGNVGTACVVPDSLGEANCADLVVIQRPRGIHSRFAAYYMNSLAQKYVRAGRVGVALVHFNTKSVAALPVPVPPWEEQRRIVAEVDRQLSAIDQLESALGHLNRRMAQARSSVLSAAFTGKLVPQDPSDEPASSVLECIESDTPGRNGRGISISMIQAGH